MELKKPKNFNELNNEEVEYDGGNIVEGCPDWLFITSMVILGAGALAASGFGIYKLCNRTAQVEEPMYRCFTKETWDAIESWAHENNVTYCYDRHGLCLNLPDGDEYFITFDSV